MTITAGHNFSQWTVYPDPDPDRLLSYYLVTVGEVTNNKCVAFVTWCKSVSEA